MATNVKLVGLGALMVLALSAMVAPVANAQVGEWGEEEEPGLTFKATQDVGDTSQLFGFTANANSITCNEVHATGNLTPSFPGGHSLTTVSTGAVAYGHAGLTENKCTGPLSTEPKVEMKSCSYTFHFETTVTSDELKSSVDLKCSGTDEATINGGGLCVIHIPPQNGLKHVLVKTETPKTTPSTVTATATVTGIKYKHTGLCGNAEAADGTYNGSATITGFKDSTQKTIAIT